MHRSHTIVLVAAAALVVLFAALALQPDGDAGRVALSGEVDSARRPRPAPGGGSLDGEARTAPRDRHDDDTPAVRRHALLGGPRGRVVSAEDGSPLAGVRVRTAFAGRVEAETISDADGRFWLPRPERQRRNVEVDDTHWRTLEPRHRLDDETSSGAREIVLRVEPLPGSILRGRIVDGVTGEPVPDFAVQVSGPWRADSNDEHYVYLTRAPEDFYADVFVTDATGRFASDGPLAHGDYQLEFFDREREGGTLSSVIRPGEELYEHGAGDEVHEHHLSIGPTYRFDLELPAGVHVEDLYANFPVATEATLADRSPDASGAVPPRVRTYSNNWLRTGERPWVRFPARTPGARAPAAPDADALAVGPYTLEVRCYNGLWLGSAEVDSIVGVHERVVRIRLEPRSVIRGEVRGVDGDTIQGARVRAHLADQPNGAVVEDHTDGDGRFELEHLPLGNVRLDVSLEFHETWSTTVTTEPNGEYELDVELTRAGDPGVISGHITSRSGRWLPEDGARVSVRRIGGELLSETHPVTFAWIDGAWTAPFRITGLEPGEYRVTAHSRGARTWDERSMRVAVPTAGVEFVYDDSDER